MKKHLTFVGCFCLRCVPSVHLSLHLRYLLVGYGLFCRFVFLPRELDDILRLEWRSALFAEHVGEVRYGPSGRFPLGVVAATDSGKVAIDFPPLHPMQEVLRVDSAFSNYDLIEVEGGYPFFAASSCFSSLSASVGLKKAVSSAMTACTSVVICSAVSMDLRKSSYFGTSGSVFADTTMQ